MPVKRPYCGESAHVPAPGRPERQKRYLRQMRNAWPDPPADARTGRSRQAGQIGPLRKIPGTVQRRRPDADGPPVPGRPVPTSPCPPAACPGESRRPAARCPRRQARACFPACGPRCPGYHAPLPKRRFPAAYPRRSRRDLAENRTVSLSMGYGLQGDGVQGTAPALDAFFSRAAVGSSCTKTRTPLQPEDDKNAPPTAEQEKARQKEQNQNLTKRLAL